MRFQAATYTWGSIFGPSLLKAPPGDPAKGAPQNGETDFLTGQFVLFGARKIDPTAFSGRSIEEEYSGKLFQFTKICKSP
jgi:hypothetical protein